MHLKPAGRAVLPLSIFVCWAAAQVGAAPRSSAPLFKGEQGKQHTYVYFDPATRNVTLKLLVQDPNGYFVPNIPRKSFVVFEDGVKQDVLSADVERSPASIALLMESGGPYPDLSSELDTELTTAGHQLIEQLDRGDKIAGFRYGERIAKLADFTADHGLLETALLQQSPPTASAAKLYDALLFVAKRMQTVHGRKGIIVLSSGVDTLSKATPADVINALNEGDSPLYVVGLGEMLQNLVRTSPPVRPFVKIDWQHINHDLMEMARASGGRAYFPENTIDLPAVFNDILENLKVRYVVKYKSSSHAPLSAERKIRVELVDPQTGRPLEIVDASGKTIRPTVIVPDAYSPEGLSARATHETK